MTTYTDFMIGTTLGGMTALRSLTHPVSNPLATFTPYSKPLNLGDGSVRGGGWIAATWDWQDVISAAERHQLRTFCTGASSSVFIATLVNDNDVYLAYSAVMIWPQEEERDFLRRVKFQIKFRALVAQT
jgi:hypothetical protein